MQKQSFIIKFTALLFLCIGAMLSGCSTKGHVADTGYLDQPERMTKSKKYPFNRQWFDANVDWAAYEKVYIAPVNIDHLKHLSWWQKASLKKKLNGSAEELARYTLSHFQDAFKQSNGRFTVVSNPGPNVLVIELGIVELVPTKAWLNAIEMAGLFMTFDKGFTAIESRMRDGGSGKVIATVADGESGRNTVFSGNDYTWWGHSKNTIDYFAKSFEEVLADGWHGRVSSRSSFALILICQSYGRKCLIKPFAGNWSEIKYVEQNSGTSLLWNERRCDSALSQGFPESRHHGWT